MRFVTLERHSFSLSLPVFLVFKPNKTLLSMRLVMSNTTLNQMHSSFRGIQSKFKLSPNAFKRVLLSVAHSILCVFVSLVSLFIELEMVKPRFGHTAKVARIPGKAKAGPALLAGTTERRLSTAIMRAALAFFFKILNKSNEHYIEICMDFV